MIKKDLDKLKINFKFNKIYSFYKKKSLSSKINYLLKMQNFKKNNPIYEKYYDIVSRILQIIPANKIQESSLKYTHTISLQDILELPEIKILKSNEVKKFYDEINEIKKIEQYKIKERGRIMSIVEFKNKKYFKKEIILTKPSKKNEAYFEIKASLDIQKKYNFIPKVEYYYYIPKQNKIVIFFQYLEDYVPISNYILTHGRLNTNQIKIISDYLNKIHKVGYFHQDLHSGNVMYKLDDPYSLKIIDFGLARDIKYIADVSNSIFEENMVHYVKYKSLMKNQVMEIIIFLLILTNHRELYTLSQKYKREFNKFRKSYAYNQTGKKYNKKIVRLMFYIMDLEPLEQKIIPTINISSKSIEETFVKDDNIDYIKYLERLRCTSSLYEENKEEFIKIKYNMTNCASLINSKIEYKKLINSMKVWENKSTYLTNFNPLLIYLPFAPIGNTQIAISKKNVLIKEEKNKNSIHTLINRFDELVLIRRFVQKFY